MYRLRPDESIEAVLNDWDLGIDARELQTHLGFEVTGTIPFMAIDLLSPEAMRGEVRHLYRHNLEAMIWVFVWIMCCYNAGRSRPVPEEVAEWTKQDPKAARGGKRSFRNNFSRTEAVNFANLFEGIQPEETDEAEKVWKEHWALVRDLCTHKALPQLGYIVDLKLIPSD
ncbi:hypothetical protein BD626DRAFT_464553 [Schizophyllum amplum]|uniref:Fungal-type protein kinase domain-containing protein n=1 Tax=Schizophyllum amplum TaxID=97359 RepID=A0A550BYX3_9AGAR|nr:hypothetical protein BD626DRAFT_464553 [Auriculariopsis ampla]